MLLDVIASLLLAASLVLLYLASFPQLKGGAGSLVYFREIGQMTEAKYIDAVTGCDDGVYARDLNGQVWRNAQILMQKFEHLKQAYWMTASALLPWLAALSASSITHAALVVR